MHLSVVGSIIDHVSKSGREVKVVSDYLLTDDDFKDVDLVMSMGGDGTFLKTASYIRTSKLPILGINTDPTRSVGHLTNRAVNFDRRDNEIKKIFTHLNRENFEFFNRSRAHVISKCDTTGKIFNELALNEVFAAEKNVSTCSVFRVKVDDDDYIGKFKSSGLLCATGTGSTGWIYSARKFTEMDVHRAL
jgi:NAD+ kinase